jgi:serine O-acetyltransferase
MGKNMSLIFSRQHGVKAKIEALLFTAGVQALVIFRLSSYLNRYRAARILRLPSLLYRLNQFLCNVDIDPHTIIGENLLLPHASGIIIGGTAVIGDDVTIMHNVTIGAKRMTDCGKRHATVENGVFISSQVTILGDITIGANARIAAGSIVLADVAANTTVTGTHKSKSYEKVEPL